MLALALAGATGEASAEGKKGPRASVSVATVCDLVDTDLVVDSKIRDKTSGDAIALVSVWKIKASYLERGVRGNQWQTLMSDEQSGLQLPVPVMVGSKFSLCAAGGGIRSELENARALNGLATITYGKDDGYGGVADERTINNRCSDDPQTLDVVEPSGIKLTRSDIAAIDAACRWSP